MMFFFFKQKTAYEMRISDWSSDVCSSDLITHRRYVDYARANASIGINGTVLNNVNASADSLTPRYIAKAAKLADIFRPYGIRVYLSARWRAEARRVGKECVGQCRSRWWR